MARAISGVRPKSWITFTTWGSTASGSDQRKDPDSLLNTIKKFIDIRKNVSKMYVEEFRIVDVDNENVMGFSYNNDLLIFINFTSTPLIVAANYDFSGYSILLEDSPYGIRKEKKKLELKGYGYRWFKKNPT